MYGFNGRPSLDNVSHWGYKSDGIFADTHTRVLPNGWIYQCPFNKNLSHDGNYYESIGIPPDYEFESNYNYLLKQYLDSEKDIILDAIMIGEH